MHLPEPGARTPGTVALAKLLFDVPTDFAEFIGEVLIGVGAGAVEEQAREGGARLVVYGEQEAELTGIAERTQAVLEATGIDTEGARWHVEIDANSNWDTAWTQYLVQQPLTPSWVIQPEWDATPAPAGMGTLRIRPVLAFGDGSHVTTRMAAEAVEHFCKEHPQSSVLDIGTGTGVLALIAVLSGARRVIGTDIDPVALSAAHENAKLNDLYERVAFCAAGDSLVGDFELVVANLEPRALVQADSDIALHARRARQLVLTGFLSEQASELSAHFHGLGFCEINRVTRDGWAMLELAPKK